MKKQKKAFSLIELIVVITIIAMVSIFTYTPYILYKNKAGVNVVTKQIAQDLYLARNMAINGISTGTGTTNKNLSVGLYLEAGKNKKIIFYGYSGSLDINNITNGEILKENIIENNIQINGIKAGANYSSGALFFFSAITGEPKIYLGDDETSLSKNTANSEFTINVGYKGVDNGILSKEISYNKKTFVRDY